MTETSKIESILAKALLDGIYTEKELQIKCEWQNINYTNVILKASEMMGGECG